MQDTSFEIKHLLSGSPLRKPGYAILVAVVFILLLGLGAYNLLWPLYGGAPRLIQTYATATGIAILVSVPTVLFLWFLDRREHESPLLLLGAAVWGAVVSTSLSMSFGTALYTYLLRMGKQTGTVFMGMSPDAFSTIVTTPIVEELVKGAAILLLFWLLRGDFDDMRDGILYGAMVGLGFNAAQYGIFVLEDFAATGSPHYLAVGALQFPFLGLNGHLVYSALFGAGLGLARQTHKSRLQTFAPLAGIALAILANSLSNSIGTKVINDLVRLMTGMRLLFAATPPFTVWIATVVGTLAANVWAYLLLGFAIYHSERWEVDTIRKQLFSEVNVSVTPREYVQVEDDAPFKGRTIPGYSPKLARAILRAQNELAYRRWHVEQEEGDIEKDEMVLAWRARIAQLRALDDCA